jgi:hypothetical protein
MWKKGHAVGLSWKVEGEVVAVVKLKNSKVRSKHLLD